MTAHRIFAAALVGVAALSLAAPGALAQTVRDASNEDWCRNWGDDDRERHCEVREFSLPARSSLRVDGAANGGVRVEGWDENRIVVRARVQATARTLETARSLASDVRIETGDVIRADVPTDRFDRRQHASVSYEIMVPRRIDLELEARNGGLSVTDVSGRLSLHTVNGGIRLARTSGDVRGRTTNGAVVADLSGRTWDGAGLDLRTTNGAVRLTIPNDYSARLETGTTNGRLNIDFPVTVQGRIGRELDITLGQGGPPLRAITTNGAVSIRRN